MNYILREEKIKLKIGTKEWYNLDEKVLFYTGLPNLSLLCNVFDLIKPIVTENMNSKLSCFSVIFLGTIEVAIKSNSCRSVLLIQRVKIYNIDSIS